MAFKDRRATEGNRNEDNTAADSSPKAADTTPRDDRKSGDNQKGRYSPSTRNSVTGADGGVERVLSKCQERDA